MEEKEIKYIISSLDGLKEIKFNDDVIDIEFIRNTINRILETKGDDNICKAH